MFVRMCALLLAVGAVMGAYAYALEGEPLTLACRRECEGLMAVLEVR